MPAALSLTYFPPVLPVALSAVDRARLLTFPHSQSSVVNPTGSVTDRTLLQEIQLHMLEPDTPAGTFISGKWTREEVLAYLNQRQRQFIRDTMLVLGLATVNTAAGALRNALPSNWVATRRAAWAPSTLGSVYQEVPKGDGWQADHSPDIRTWPTTLTSGRPSLYMDAELPHLEFQLAPAPSQAGTLELLQAEVPPTLTGEGVLLVVPDEFAPGIKYGAMADMLSKRGDGFDPERAAYCESRYEEAVVAAALLWMS